MPDLSCSVTGCARLERMAGGMCGLHYQRLRRTGSTDDPVRDAAKTACAVEGCSKIGKVRSGMCGTHYQRFTKYGSPSLPPRPWRQCEGPSCNKSAGDHGLCRSHYKQRHLGKPLTALLVATKDLGRPAFCQFPGCERPHKARGWCKAHRDHIAKGQELHEVKVYDPDALCSIEGCGEPNLARSLCRRHIQTQYDVVRRYGLTLDAYEALIEQQDGKCAICHGVNANGYRLSIDHDHACCPGSYSCGDCVRGLLCANCNYALGHMRDDVARLFSAVNYLTTHALKGGAVA